MHKKITALLLSLLLILSAALPVFAEEGEEPEFRLLLYLSLL